MTLSTTFTLPNGHKVRTTTNSHYVLVGDGADKGFVLKRSNKVAVLKAEDRRLRNRGSFGPRYLGDTVSGSIQNVLEV